ncbi:MAG TPA: putative metallopeptidase [Fimbriiglobus sp.]|nr:putative metallopeptidase [Fimbriiglobus sp.]
MSVTERRPAIRPMCVLERRWDHATRPLPRRWVLPNGNGTAGRPDAAPLDFTTRMSRLCGDVVARCPELGHIDTAAVLFTFTAARNRSAYGLQARVTPMRFRDGAVTRRVRGTLFQVQRYFVGGREMLYLVTFCLPRFLDQTFEEKLVTVFHELYHISPNFDGDLRRHEGRYAVHSRSKRAYDERMAALARRYLAGHPDPGRWDFLRPRAARLWRDHGGVFGVSVPRPQMVPVF